MKTFSITDTGITRDMNQDYYFSSDTPVGNLPNLYIVADGMGGHKAGDYASRYTIERIVASVMRSGLQETFYKRKYSDNRFTSIARANTLDEITNTYITEIIVNRIMSFTNYDIKNSNLKRYLKSLVTKQPDGRYRAIGYNNEVRLLYPLLLNDMFINLVNQCEFDGNLDLVKNFIETNTDICSYDDFCKILDEVYKENIFFAKYVQEKNMDKINRHVENINKIKSVVMSIKENLDCSVLKKV